MQHAAAIPCSTYAGLISRHVTREAARQMKEEARLIEQQNKEQLTKREAEEAAYELGLQVCVSV